MPEFVDVENEETEASDQAVSDQNTQRKQSNKDYLDRSCFVAALVVVAFLVFLHSIGTNPTREDETNFLKN